MARINKIKDYEVKSGDIFFFDNNIWMFIFAQIANSNHPKQQIYSKFLRDVQSARASIFVSSLILSEYINRSMRLGFEQWKESTQNFAADYKKDYRNTDDYKETLEVVKSEVKEIIKLCDKMPDNFNAINEDIVFKNMDQCDFNDAYYAEMCKIDNLKLVTDDADLKNISTAIDIITY